VAAFAAASVREGLAAVGGNHRPVREESQLEAMREAIRGDFDRLAERRGGQELLRPTPPGAEPDPETERQPEPVLESETALADEPAAQVEDTVAEEVSRRGFWSRLRGL
jgi:hypothetical protein